MIYWLLPDVPAGQSLNLLFLTPYLFNQYHSHPSQLYSVFSANVAR